MKETKNSEHPYSYAELSKVIHEQARLGILTALFNNAQGYSFKDLKILCDLSDGNLSKHLKVLTEKNFVSVDKSFKNKKSHTHSKMTNMGRDAFLEYLQKLEEIVHSNVIASKDWNNKMNLSKT